MARIKRVAPQGALARLNMDILYLLIPLSVVLAFAIGVAFWRAVDGGQFDDLDRPALDVVLDDDRPSPPEA